MSVKSNRKLSAHGFATLVTTRDHITSYYPSPLEANYQNDTVHSRQRLGSLWMLWGLFNSPYTLSNSSNDEHGSRKKQKTNLFSNTGRLISTTQISVVRNKIASRPGPSPASLLVTSASLCDAVIYRSCSVCRSEMTEKNATGFHSSLGF